MLPLRYKEIIVYSGAHTSYHSLNWILQGEHPLQVHKSGLLIRFDFTIIHDQFPSFSFDPSELRTIQVDQAVERYLGTQGCGENPFQDASLPSHLVPLEYATLIDLITPRLSWRKDQNILSVGHHLAHFVIPMIKEFIVPHLEETNEFVLQERVAVTEDGNTLIILFYLEPARIWFVSSQQRMLRARLQNILTFMGKLYAGILDTDGLIQTNRVLRNRERRKGPATSPFQRAGSHEGALADSLAFQGGLG